VATGTGRLTFDPIAAPAQPRRSYYASTRDIAWPPEVHAYNETFTKCLQKIKTRHDPTVMTVACVSGPPLLGGWLPWRSSLTSLSAGYARSRGILEWKHSKKSDRIGLSIQQFLDRFHMSRIGIRFLIGQRSSCLLGLHRSPHIFADANRRNLDRHRPQHARPASGLRRHHLQECRASISPSVVESWASGADGQRTLLCSLSQNVHEICTEAIENAKFVCGDHYALFKVPDVHLVCDPNLTFPFVPGHLCDRRSCRSFRTIPDSLLTSALRSQGPHHL
jgi:pyruvate dehydrogenase kinase 2/3/4